MKKYLMTGVAALALCAGFTSCSHDVDGMLQEELNDHYVQKIVESYEKAFIENIGQPAPYQDWGFGSSSAVRTRSNSANSNHWGATADDPNTTGFSQWEYGWITPPVLTAGQKLRVTRYFQTHPNPGYTDPHWQHFFVQQVYQGSTDIAGETAEIYRDASKTTAESADPWIKAGFSMNYLNALLDNGSWDMDHINNFNGGEASYKPVLETGEPVNGGKTHEDKINLMVNSSTADFSYQNSDGSLFHNRPYVALVSAKDIDDWARTLAEPIGEDVYYGKDVNGIDNSYWNRHFMGCDYELLVGEDIYAGTNMKLTDVSSLGATGRFVNGEFVSGIPEGDYLYNNQPVRYLKSNQNMYGGDLVKLDDSELCYDYRADRYDAEGHIIANNDYFGKVLNTARFDDLLKDGYLPVAGSNLKNWVKPQAVADGYYSDWIVTLTEGKRQGYTPPTPPPTTGKIRVIAEDLTATTGNDFDFNDIVFDVTYGEANVASITVQAAGGTLPLRIKVGAGNTEADYQEVHALWEQSPSIMINTHAENRYPGRGVSNLPAKNVTLGYAVKTPTDVRDLIKIEVQKSVGNTLTWVELKSERGKPAAKIAVNPNWHWLDERVNITTVSGFVNYVTNGDTWEGSLPQ